MLVLQTSAFYVVLVLQTSAFYVVLLLQTSAFYVVLVLQTSAFNLSLFLLLTTNMRSDSIYRVIHKSSGTSELDCATTKKDAAERSISIGRESLKVFFVLWVLAYLQVPPLGGSRDEKWRAQ